MVSVSAKKVKIKISCLCTFKGSLVMRKKGGRDGGYRQVVWPQTAVINVFVFQAKKDISISAQQSKINRRFRLHFSVGNARRMFRCASPI
jgi:hypothetical protein